jgi:hypothetical protein
MVTGFPDRQPLQSPIADAPNPLRRLENFTRIENFGPPDTHWLRVTVDPNGRQVFKVELMTVEKNRRAFKP